MVQRSSWSGRAGRWLRGSREQAAIGLDRHGEAANLDARVLANHALAGHTHLQLDACTEEPFEAPHVDRSRAALAFGRYARAPLFQWAAAAAAGQIDTRAVRRADREDRQTGAFAGRPSPQPDHRERIQEAQ